MTATRSFPSGSYTVANVTDKWTASGATRTSAPVRTNGASPVIFSPAKSREEAVERFCAGDFAHEDDFIELKTGKRYHYSQYGIEQQILRYLAHWSAEQVKRLGFDSKLVDTLAMQRTLDRMGDKYVDVFDTTLLCPNCGMKGEYRKAVSPITHTKTWWRVGCPYCKTRTRYSFPSQREAAEKFESAQLDTKPSILNEKSKL